MADLDTKEAEARNAAQMASQADITQTKTVELLRQLNHLDHRLQLSALLSAAAVLVERHYKPQHRYTAMGDLLGPTLLQWAAEAQQQ